MQVSDTKTLNSVFGVPCYEWQDTISYLAMQPSELPATKAFRFIFAAAIISIDEASRTPQLLLIQRSSNRQKALGKWELPGGKISTDASSVEEALRGKIFWETGLTVTSILGATRRKPTIFPARPRFPEDPGMVHLTYLVQVDAAEVLNLHEDYSTWKWVRNVEEARKLKITFADLKTVRKAFEALSTILERSKATGKFEA